MTKEIPKQLNHTEREKIQRELTAKYLTGKINLNKYKAEMKKVETPFDLVALASRLKLLQQIIPNKLTID